MTGVVFTCFLAAWIVQVIYWLGVHLRGVFSPLDRGPSGTDLSESSPAAPPVSVIVCARNEAENLQKNLPLILNQVYRSFELIVVNDHSTDKTLDVLKHMRESRHTFRIVNFTNMKFSPGKKDVLAAGIAAATNEWLLLTDADCAPASVHWIRDMLKPATRSGTGVILGYSPYRPLHGVLGAVIGYETLLTAVQYFGWARCGHPYMGVGRNLAYRKSLYRAAGGFAAHRELASGDDDLLIGRIARAENTQVVLDDGARTVSPPPHTWPDWVRQKRRHLSTGTRYAPLTQVLLGGFGASHLAVYTLGAALLLTGYAPWAGGLLTARMLLLAVLFAVLRKRLPDSPPVWQLLLADGCWPLYYLFFTPFLFLHNRITWK